MFCKRVGCDSYLTLSGGHMEEYAYIKPKEGMGITQGPKWILRSEFPTYQSKWYIDATKFAEDTPTGAP